jgi:hypothetical protein
MLFLSQVATLSDQPRKALHFAAALAIVGAITILGVGRWLNAVAADPHRPRWADEVRRYESGESPVIRVTPAGWVLKPIKTQSKVDYRSRASSADLRLIVEMPKLGTPLKIRVESDRPGTAGVLLVESGSAPIEHVGSDSLTSINPTNGSLARMLKNPTEGPGYSIPFVLDARGIAIVVLKISDDLAYLGRTYTLQARIDSTQPAYTEIVTLRLGK